MRAERAAEHAAAANWPQHLPAGHVPQEVSGHRSQRAGSGRGSLPLGGGGGRLMLSHGKDVLLYTCGCREMCTGRCILTWTLQSEEWVLPVWVATPFHPAQRTQDSAGLGVTNARESTGWSERC